MNKETAIDVDDESGVARKKAKGTTGKAVTNSGIDVDSFVTHILNSFNLLDIDTIRQSDSDKELVERVITAYNFLWRKFSQLEEKKDPIRGRKRRPDLKAGTICVNKGALANINKRIGSVPGIDIGDVFFFRFEMCLVGLHTPTIAGIDFMSVRFSGIEEQVAVSIVSSEVYENKANDDDDDDVLIYSGTGGLQTKDKPQTDQQLIRGNLALEKSLHRGTAVRVIRGLKDHQYTTGKVYVYDGLYKTKESWIERGKSGCDVFKYKLVRIPGQKEGFTLWKSIQRWKNSRDAAITTRSGFILPDLSSGQEKLPVSLVNDVDNETGPASFKYIRTVKYKNPFPLINSSSTCTCIDGCQPGSNCPCVQKNNGYMPYTSLGVLLSHNKLIHECGNSCRCPDTCRNRISQAGLKVRLEVFKTKEKGWGVRSWDPIRAGAFICEYAGVVIEGKRIDFDDDYVFDATRVFETVESVASDEHVKFPFPLIISGKKEGNVGRFMNHSCLPNVYWQPIVREYQHDAYFHVGFYAIRHIAPMQELVYNYGMVRGKGGARRKKCLCRSARCKGSFY